MSTAEKLNIIAQNTKEVFDKGKAVGIESFWDGFQKNGTITSFSYLFSGRGWNDAIFKPKYDITIGNNMVGTFTYNGVSNLKKALEDAGVTLDTKGTTNFTNAFSYSLTTHLPKIDCSTATNINSIFANCTNLISIDEWVLSSSSTNATSAFTGCTKLEHIKISGTIATSGLNFSPCVNLSAESIESILSHLGGTSASTLTLPSTAPTTYDAFYGEGAFTAKVNARPSNWTIAY